MNLPAATVRAATGDEIVVTLSWLGDEPTIMLSVLDVDDTSIPTAEMTLREASELRETIRKLCEEAVCRGR